MSSAEGHGTSPQPAPSKPETCCRSSPTTLPLLSGSHREFSYQFLASQDNSIPFPWGWVLSLGPLLLSLTG